MFGNIPFCGPIPTVKGHEINFLARSWGEKEHVEFLAIILLTQVLQTKFTLHEADTDIKIVSTFIDLSNSHIQALRKYPIFHLVSYHVFSIFGWLISNWNYY